MTHATGDPHADMGARAFGGPSRVDFDSVGESRIHGNGDQGHCAHRSVPSERDMKR